MALAKALEDEPTFRMRVRDRLRKAEAGTPEAEQALLTRALSLKAKQKETSSRLIEVKPGLWLEARGQGEKAQLILKGAGLDEALETRLVAWLRNQV